MKTYKENFNGSLIKMVNKLKPYAINLTKNIDEANDLLQETMYRALANKDKFKDGTNLKAWLFTIMRNIFINAYRRKSKYHTIIDTTDNLYYLNNTSTIIKNGAEGNFVLKDTQNAIEKLSDDYKVPFLMYFEGFKYQEIAKDLELPLGTVKSRIFFARKELKKRLNAYQYIYN
ncbi:MAG: RNA polymerase sigma factor [Chitinophagales bacterium]